MFKASERSQPKLKAKFPRLDLLRRLRVQEEQLDAADELTEPEYVHLTGGVFTLVSGPYNQFTPYRFVTTQDYHSWGVTEEDAKVLRSSPDSPGYWAVWEDILANGMWVTTNDEGVRREWHLHLSEKDGSVIAYCIDLLTEAQRKWLGFDIPFESIL